MAIAIKYGNLAAYLSILFVILQSIKFKIYFDLFALPKITP